MRKLLDLLNSTLIKKASPNHLMTMQAHLNKILDRHRNSLSDAAYTKIAKVLQLLSNQHTFLQIDDHLATYHFMRNTVVANQTLKDHLQNVSTSLTQQFQQVHLRTFMSYIFQNSVPLQLVEGPSPSLKTTHLEGLIQILKQCNVSLKNCNKVMK